MIPSGRCAWLAVGLAVAVLAGCHRGRKAGVAVAAPVPRLVLGATEEGIASWYGHPYHGRRTSNGELYDMEQMTAAHRTLPFGTRVHVENLSNGRDVEVRINDRGPFVNNRVIDLSRAAARQIQMIGPGTARVRVRIVGLPQSLPSGWFAVQVGSFRNEQNAERLRQDLARAHGTAAIQRFDSPRGLFYRVLVGRESDIAGAESLAQRLRQQGLSPFVVRFEENRL